MPLPLNFLFPEGALAVLLDGPDSGGRQVSLRPDLQRGCCNLLTFRRSREKGKCTLSLLVGCLKSIRQQANFAERLLQEEPRTML